MHPDFARAGLSPDENGLRGLRGPVPPRAHENHHPHRLTPVRVEKQSKSPQVPANKRKSRQTSQIAIIAVPAGSPPNCGDRRGFLWFLRRRYLPRRHFAVRILLATIHSNLRVAEAAATTLGEC